MGENIFFHELNGEHCVLEVGGKREGHKSFTEKNNGATSQAKR